MKSTVLKTKILFALCFACLGGLLHAQIVPVGSGSYIGDSYVNGPSVIYEKPSFNVNLSGPALSKPITTSDWWTDMMVKDHGSHTFNYPLSFKSKSNGLGINYTVPTLNSVTGRQYVSAIANIEGVIVGLENLNTTKSTVHDHTDWDVTLNWGDQFFSKLTMNSPFMYFEKAVGSGNAMVRKGSAPGTIRADGNKIIIENNLNGSNYVVFAPAGSTWTGSGDVFTSNLNGKNYWSMVMLPPGADVNQTIAAYEKYAYVFPSKTEVSWNYNETNGKVTTTFTVTPDVKEGSHTSVLQGLLPHQWDHLAPRTEKYSYPLGCAEPGAK